MKESATIRYIVRGLVQGVGFRWFVLTEAGALDLDGFVRNRPDGSVEIVARGDAGALAELECVLARGPVGARIEGVDKSEISHDMDLPNPFGIR